MTPAEHRMAIARFVQTHGRVGRSPPNGWARPTNNLSPSPIVYVTAPLPTAETLANQFLVTAESPALQLGTWLGTTEGSVLAEAVALAVPEWLDPEYSLIVEALKIAAGRQRGESWLQIGRGVAVGAVVSLIVAAVFKSELAL